MAGGNKVIRCGKDPEKFQLQVHVPWLKIELINILNALMRSLKSNQEEMLLYSQSSKVCCTQLRTFWERNQGVTPHTATTSNSSQAVF